MTAASSSLAVLAPILEEDSVSRIAFVTFLHIRVH